MTRQVTPWPAFIFAAVAILIAVYSVVGYRNLRTLVDDYDWVARSHGVLHEIDAVLSETNGAEIATRGFIVTGDTAYVSPYEQSARAAQEHLLALKKLTRDNSTQQWRAERLDRLVTDKSGVMREIMRARREAGLPAAQTLMRESRGPDLMEEIQELVAEMRSTETQLLEFRGALTRSTYRTALRAGVVMAAAALLLLTASYILFWSAYSNQRKAAQTLASRKAELEEAVRVRTAELRTLAEELEQRVNQRTAELARANQDLRLENLERERVEEALKEADRRKDEFLAMLGHELRNPLMPIRLALDMLHLPVREERQRAAEILDRQVRQLIRIVDDLMDVSRIALGKVRLEKETISIERAVHDAIEVARPAIEERRHQLETVLPDRPILVCVDPARLGQVLQNLLTNAAKYTEPGGRISVRVQSRNGLALIRIRDNGLGIAPEQLPQIFEPYEQAERTLPRAEGGIGIGLTLVRRLVEMHGGRVSVASEGVGKGSEFTVHLPVVETVATSASSPQDALGGSGSL